jgi:hypothetical protein
MGARKRRVDPCRLLRVGPIVGVDASGLGIAPCAPFLHDALRDSLRGDRGPERMAEIVEANAADSGAVERREKALADLGAVERLPVSGWPKTRSSSA